MCKIILLCALMLLVGTCYAGRVYVEDEDVVIPIDTRDGDVKSVNNSDGTQTWIYDKPGQTDIVHGDGTTTSVYDNGNRYVR